VVSLSHIHAPCLNRSTDLHAIWYAHFLGSETHCVSWGTLIPAEKGDFGGRTFNHNMQLQIAAAHSALANRKKAISPDTKSLWLHGRR